MKSSSSLTPNDVAEFQALLQRECNLQLDVSEGWKRASQLMTLVRMLIGPILEDPEGKPCVS